MTDITANVAPATANQTAASSLTPTSAQATDWVQNLDQDARQLVQVKGYRSPNDLAKAYMHAERAIGSEKIAIPGKEAKPEDWAQVWNKLGRPPKPDGYDLKKPHDAGSYNEELAGWYKQAAHQAGLTGKQATALHDTFVQYIQQHEKIQNQQLEGKRQQLERQLEQEWGPSYDANLTTARRAAQLFADTPDMLQSLEYAIGGPQMLRLFHRIGKHLGEDSMAGGSGRGQGNLSGSQARAEIARLQGDGEFSKKWLDKSHPEHNYAISRMQDLHRLMLGER